jgi:hypothetical protein
MLLAGLVDALMALLPAWEWSLADLPNTGSNMTVWDNGEVVTSSVSSIAGPWAVLARMNGFVPIDHLILVFLVMAAAVVAFLAFRGVRYILNMIRGAGA